MPNMTSLMIFSVCQSQQVHQCVTRLRTEINEQRQKAGLQRIYLLNKAPEGAAAAEAVSKRKSKAASQHKA